MPIQDVWGFMLNPYISSTLTVYTPSNVIVQGAISIAEFVGGGPVNIGGGARVQQVNIPGYGELELGDTTTVRWVLNSITFSAPVVSTILVLSLIHI